MLPVSVLAAVHKVPAVSPTDSSVPACPAKRFPVFFSHAEIAVLLQSVLSVPPDADALLHRIPDKAFPVLTVPPNFLPCSERIAALLLHMRAFPPDNTSYELPVPSEQPADKAVPHFAHPQIVFAGSARLQAPAVSVQWCAVSFHKLLPVQHVPLTPFADRYTAVWFVPVLPCNAPVPVFVSHIFFAALKGHSVIPSYADILAHCFPAAFFPLAISVFVLPVPLHAVTVPMPLPVSAATGSTVFAVVPNHISWHYAVYPVQYPAQADPLSAATPPVPVPTSAAVPCLLCNLLPKVRRVLLPLLHHNPLTVFDTVAFVLHRAVQPFSASFVWQAAVQQPLDSFRHSTVLIHPEWIDNTLYETVC